jgi:hypothetical protein
MKPYAFALMLALGALQPGVVHAQTAAAAPDPARLRAAQALIAQLMPPERRDAMIDQMMRPMIDNMKSSMIASPMFKDVSSDPKLRRAFDEFLSAELDHSIALTKQVMPELIEAMTRAYARRFTLVQLNDIAAFYATPSGRAFAEQAATIMADPDVLAAQTHVMRQAMEGAQERAAALATKLAAQQEQK